MNLFELFLIAIGLSMDAFAVSICMGLAMKKTSIKKSLTIGLYFGIFQGAMPIIGYLVGTQFADKITAIDHWVAFMLLLIIGGLMIKESLEKSSYEHNCNEPSLSPKHLLPLAVATSIDALVVGISFAFLNVDIIPAVSFIGITTLLLSIIGVKIGNLFGTRYKSKAEIIGGIILIVMGFKILLEHTVIL